MYSVESVSLELLRERFEIALEITGKSQGKLREFNFQKCGHPVIVA